MRPKFIAVLLFSALGFLGLVAWVEEGFRTPPVAPTADDRETLGSKRTQGNSPSPGKGLDEERVSGRRMRTMLPSGPAADKSIGRVEAASETEEAAHEEYVRERINELDRLARKRSAYSLNVILSELENPDQAIRLGALAATIEFRDRSSIPRLREVVASTEDPKEKVEILKAIEYLELPTLTEYLAEQQATTGSAEPPPNP